MSRKPLPSRLLRHWKHPHRFAAVLALALGCFPCAHSSEPDIGFRNWTKSNGENVRARLVGLVNGQVQLRQLSDGSIIELKFKALAPEDQTYVEERAHLVWHRDTVAWPTTLRPVRDFRVDELQAGSHYVYNTPHFSFRSDVRLSPDLMRAYSLVFESTHYALQSLPLGLQPETPSSGHFKVKLFRRHQDFQDAGGHLGSAGMYLLQTKEILIPLASLGVNIVGEQVPLNPRTFDPTPLKHEITHQLMHNWLSLVPVWFAEGMAEYVCAVPFDDGEFDFTRIDQGIKDHLTRKYGVQPSKSGSYAIDVIPPKQLMSLSHKDWSQAIDGGTRAELNYRSSLLLLYFFIHIDGKGDATNLVEYLRTARMDCDLQAQFVENYNEAVRDFNQRFQVYTEEAKRYNEALLKHREEAIAYNQRVDRYNEQILAKVPLKNRIDVGPEPVAPTLPKKPELPEILNQNPKDRFPLNLTQIEERARTKLTADRSYEQLWNQMKAALLRQNLLLREVAPAS